VASAWEVLVEAGLPDGAVRPGPRSLDRSRVREAIDDLARHPEALAANQIEPLLAWLRGWRHHWRSSFVTSLGAGVEDLITRLEERGPDRNRYLKLRRIAVENLSRVL
jgi:hypothetical protein